MSELQGELSVGSAIEVELIADGKSTQLWVAAEVRELKRDHVSQAVRSVRVRAVIRGKVRFAWVQPEHIRMVSQ